MMKHPERLCVFGLVVAIAHGLSVTRGCALSLHPSSWEEQVYKSEFAGLVACEVGGGPVATYRVIEAWKGNEYASREIRLRMDASFSGSLEIATVGDTYVVLARGPIHSAGVPPVRQAWQTPNLGGINPLEWRLADYDLYVFDLTNLGGYGLPHTGLIGRNGIVDADWESALSRLRKRTERHVAQDSDTVELRMLNEGFRKYIENPNERSPKDSEARRLMRRLTNSHSTLGWMENAFEIMGADFETWIESAGPLRRDRRDAVGSAVFMAIRSLGRNGVDQWFESKIENGTSFVGEWERIRHARIQDKERRFPELKESDASPEDILRHRSNLLEPLRPYIVDHRSFRFLSHYDSDWALDYLVKWRPMTDEPRSQESGYHLASVFCVACPGKREESFLRLDLSEVDMVRVTAATYLAFENPKLGLKRLRQLAKQDSVAGDWAALSLARRGEESAAPLALRAFSRDSDECDLRRRLMALIGNSLKASEDPVAARLLREPNYGLIVDKAVDPALSLASNLKWWSKVKDIVELRDPWFEIYAEQKID